MPRHEPPTTPDGGSSYAHHDPNPPSDPRPPEGSTGYPDQYPAYPETYAGTYDGTYGTYGGHPEYDEAYSRGPLSHAAYSPEEYPGPGWSGDTRSTDRWPADRWPADRWSVDRRLPDPRPPDRSGVVLRRLALVLGVTLFICGAASGTGYLLLRDDAKPAVGTASPEPSAKPSPAPSPELSPELSPAPTPDRTPLPRTSTDARFVAKGQCVRNDGDYDTPRLTITPCGPQTYEVLERFDGPTTGKDDAKSKCSAVPGYTDWYFFDSPLDALDYVLCLKSR